MSESGVASLRLVFFGTPELATPTLARLADGAHEVVCVVSQPDRRRGRGRKTSPSPVSALAQERGIPLLRPERIGDAEANRALHRFAPDLGVVVAYGQFIPRPVRELPNHGYLINAHASLLPRLRGAAPIARAVLNGETHTGISVMRVEREMDAGAVALVREIEIGADETTGELEGRLGELAADAIAAAVDLIARGEARWVEQDHAQATAAPKLDRDDAILDWSESATALVRRVRACAPRPGASTVLDGEPLRILAATALAGDVDRDPGSVRLTADDRHGPIWIATGSGWLAPSRVQRAGGKPLDIADFLRGRPIDDGVRFTVPPRSPRALDPSTG